MLTEKTKIESYGLTSCLKTLKLKNEIICTNTMNVSEKMQNKKILNK